jgi:hypothetical protein
MYIHAFPIRVPSDVLEALGEHTGHFWSDSLALEPFVCEAIRPAARELRRPALLCRGEGSGNPP